MGFLLYNKVEFSPFKVFIEIKIFYVVVLNFEKERAAPIFMSKMSIFAINLLNINKMISSKRYKTTITIKFKMIFDTH